MITRGCYIFTLLVSYVFSIPVPSDQVGKDDIKVMKCIVEVIADTLNKPRPIPISQECQDSLTGDDRIVSILRHQNLLKELQEIAAEGVSERVHHDSPQKKNGEDSDQVTDALGGHPGVEDTTGPSTAREEADQKGDTPEGGNEVEEESRERSGESREGNEIGGTNEGGLEEEKEGGHAKDTSEENDRSHISVSVNQSQEEEEQKEEEEKMAPGEEEERKEEDETHSSSGEDEGKGNEGNETEEDDSTQVGKGGEARALKAGPEAESGEKRSEQEEEEEEEAEEDEMEGEPEKKRSSEEAEKEGEAANEAKEDGESGPGFERWSERGEESPHKAFEGAEEGNPMEEKQGSPQLLWYGPHHSKETGGEAQRRSPEAQELHMMARGETAEKREEEGSASHRGEDHEIARLAAIESELESVAQRLHELRRG